MAIEASDPPASLSTAQAVSHHRDTNDTDLLVQPFESLSTMDLETSSRYLWHQKNGNKNVLSSAQSWPAASHRTVQASSTSRRVRPAASVGAVTSLSNGNGNRVKQLGYASSTHAQALTQARPTTADILLSSGFRTSSGNTSRISHSSSAPNLHDGEYSEASISYFPPGYAAQRNKQSSSKWVLKNMEDVCSAHKSLVEKLQAALEYDKEKYTAFKELSGQFCQGLISTDRYLDYVQRHGLSHLVLELARLCPDVQKQKELIDTYNARLQSNGLKENGGAQGSVRLKGNDATKQGKWKSVDAAGSNLKDILSDSILSSVRKLQSNYKPSEEEAEVLSKDGYRPSKGKTKVNVEEQQVQLNSSNQPSIKIGPQNESLPVKVGSGDGGGGSKQRKKTSKFHLVRFGDGSMASLLDLKNSEPELLDNRVAGSSQNSTGAVPVRGVWKKGTKNLFL